MFGAFEVKVAEIRLPESVRCRPGHVWVTARAEVTNNGDDSAANCSSPNYSPGHTDRNGELSAVGGLESDGATGLPPLGMARRSSSPAGSTGSRSPNNYQRKEHQNQVGQQLPPSHQPRGIVHKHRHITLPYASQTTSRHSVDGSSYHEWQLAEGGDASLWLNYLQVPLEEQPEYPAIGGKVTLELWFLPLEVVDAELQGRSDDYGDDEDGAEQTTTTTTAPAPYTGRIPAVTGSEMMTAREKATVGGATVEAELLATTTVHGLALATLPPAKAVSLGQQQNSAFIEAYPRYASVTSVVATQTMRAADQDGEEEEEDVQDQQRNLHPESCVDTAYFRALIRYVPLDFLIDHRDSTDGRQFKCRCASFPYGAMPLNVYASFASLGCTLMARTQGNAGGETENTVGVEHEEQQQETGTVLSRRSRGGGGSALEVAGLKKEEEGPPKPVRLSRKLLSVLGSLPHRHRWELLTDLNLSCEIIGDSGLPVVLSVVNQCRGLLTLNVDRNSLTLVSAKRLMSELRTHPTLESLSAGDNSFYESAGEEILRLLRVNRRIVRCHLAGNSLSPYLLKRFGKQLDMNLMERDSDPFNALGANYNYLTSSFESLSAEVWGEIKKIWTILTVGSVPGSLEDHLSNESMVLSSHPTAGSRVGGISSRSMTREKILNGGDQQDGGGGIAGSSSLDATIPLLATTALFRDVMQSVETHFCAIYEDPYVRRLFSEASNAMVRIQPLPTVTMGWLGGGGTDGRSITGQFSSRGDPPYMIGGTSVINVAVSGVDYRSGGSAVPRTIQQQQHDGRSPPEGGGHHHGSSSSGYDNNNSGAQRASAEALEDDQEYRGTFFPQCFTKLLFLPLRVASEYPHRWSDCVRILRGLGKTHRQLGVRPHHYQAASKATLQALTNHLGPSVMGESSTRAAWVQFFTLVQRIVLSGTGDVM